MRAVIKRVIDELETKARQQMPVVGPANSDYTEGYVTGKIVGLFQAADELRQVLQDG